MKRKILLFLLAALLLPVLWGCGNRAGTEASMAETQTLETAPLTTVPADGNPGDVTCKGSYTGTPGAGSIAAVIGDTKLTNGQLNVWYWAQVAQYQQEQHEENPDFDAPLDAQTCQIDSSVGSWQQYFLRQALDAWHTAQALELQSQEDGAPTEAVYKPNPDNHAKYMTGMPALSVLYGYNKPYRHNTLHQEYLDRIPVLTEEMAAENGYADSFTLAQKAFGTTVDELEEGIRLYNSGYMYFTALSYDIALTEEEIQQQFAENEEAYAGEGITRDSGYTVDLQHILLIPDQDNAAGIVKIADDGKVTCSEDHWNGCLEEAEELLLYWQRKTKHHQGAFADLAYRNSQDTGSAKNGGSYRNLRQGQLIPELDSWAFDPARVEGDTQIIRTEYGVHILYFSGKTEFWHSSAAEDAAAEKAASLLKAAKERFPADIRYEDIVLTEAEGTVTLEGFLYPDVAHERFPEVPLYLQQDYPGVMYGGYELRTHGCGITTMSMLASYMTDDEWTPPEMCAKYGTYCFHNGTDGMIFIYEPPVLGFYLIEKTYEPPIARAALEEGHIVLSIQHKGYWTGGGHYLLLEDIDENGMVQVRDSNIFNYGKLPAHKEDRHTWGSITSNGSGFWIFDYKLTRIPACSRCGEAQETNAPLRSSYLCEKCIPALQRRNIWLEECSG